MEFSILWWEFYPSESWQGGGGQTRSINSRLRATHRHLAAVITVALCCARDREEIGGFQVWKAPFVILLERDGNDRHAFLLFDFRAGFSSHLLLLNRRYTRSPGKVARARRVSFNDHHPSSIMIPRQIGQRRTHFDGKKKKKLRVARLTCIQDPIITFSFSLVHFHDSILFSGIDIPNNNAIL